VDRRRFLTALCGSLGLGAVGCVPRPDVVVGGPRAPTGLPAPRLRGPAELLAIEGQVGSVTWDPVPGVTYAVEHNGRSRPLATPGRYDLAFGNGGEGLIEADNVIRVADVSSGPPRWSDPLTVRVQPAGRLRTRGFDFEADGPIDRTVADPGTAFDLSAAFAWGPGKGARVASNGSSTGRSYRQLTQLPSAECWLRASVRLLSGAGRVVLGRIASLDPLTAEHLLWEPARGVTTTRLGQVLAIAPGAWLQVQLGVRADGSVELWSFDGDREQLVGRAPNAGLAGPVKRIVSFGNSFEVAAPYEFWLDHLAIADRRQPWVDVERPPLLVRPRQLRPASLPPVFSFVFGSCLNPNHVPLDGTALAAAAATSPSFVLHLGDHGYADTSAWAQNGSGYLAHWAGLMSTEHIDALARVPWISMASDHDLGTNDASSVTLQPFADAAFTAWQTNDPSADGIGRYGAVTFDSGAVVLAWTEGVAHRVPLGTDGTFLGDAQRQWLLDLLASTTAGLVIIASQTTIGHQAVSGWSANPTERAQVLAAARACRAQVRFLSGDYHAARWALLGPRVAEWGAAPLAEFPQPPPRPASGVLDHGFFTVGNFRSRPEALAVLTLDEFNAATTFGRVVIDTNRHEAAFALFDNTGALRVDQAGRPMAETVSYGGGG
jgi:PhoD-like phosphatase